VGVVVSPELALIDAELRARACAELPDPQPNSCAADFAFDELHPPVAVATVKLPWWTPAAQAVHWLVVLATAGGAGVLVCEFLAHLR